MKKSRLTQKNKSRYDKLVEKASPKRVRILFQDEAGFGRISEPKACWCRKGVRPTVPCHHIREYRYVYGAVEPETGDGCFWVMTRCDTESMNFFLEKLSEQYTDTIFCSSVMEQHGINQRSLLFQKTSNCSSFHLTHLK